MRKKQLKPTDKKVAADEKLKREPPTDKTACEADKPFDFGGLPDRDLKKNLGGCG